LRRANLWCKLRRTNRASQAETERAKRVRVLAIGVPLYGYANAYSYRRFRSVLLIHIMEFRGILGRDRSRSFQPARPRCITTDSVRKPSKLRCRSIRFSYLPTVQNVASRKLNYQHSFASLKGQNPRTRTSGASHIS
jgi:hypothetical protein